MSVSLGRSFVLLLALAAGTSLGCSGSADPTPSAPAPVKEAPKGPLTAPAGSLASPKAVTGAMPAALQAGMSYASVKITCCTNARVNRVLDRDH